MNNKALSILLRLISVNGSLTPLTSNGFTHSQVALMIQEAIELDYACMSEDKLIIADKGRAFLEKYYLENKISDSDQWVMPQDRYYTEPIGKYDIIFPKKI